MKPLLAVALLPIALSAAAQVPANVCGNPNSAQFLLTAMNERGGGAANQVVDILNITTDQADRHGLKCHMTIVIGTMQHIPGVMTYRSNFAGQPVIEWVPDWVTGR